MKIKTRLFIWSGILFVITCAAIVVLVNYSMKQQALVEAEEKIKIMSNQYLAIHTYFSQKLKPALFAFTEPLRSNEYFDPTWMSSTYALREIHNYIIKAYGNHDYCVRDAAINARAPENEATPLEREFIAALKENPKLQTQSDIQDFDGKPYLVVLHRGELMEESCLRCHGFPEQAPDDLVRLYGPDRSFNRKVGDTVSAISIRVPLSSAYAGADRFSIKLSAMILTLLFTFLGAFFGLINRLIYTPLARIHEKAIAISNSKERLGEEIEPPSGRELKELTATFNRMSIALRDNFDNLEKIVQERTSELVIVNEQLNQEITERKRAEEQIQRSLREKEVMLKEIHHRVKNNMQVILSLLSLQADEIADDAVRAMFEESRNRINSMALVHDKLYRSEDLAHVDFKEYLLDLLDEIAITFNRSGVGFSVDMDSIAIDVNAGIPCGLIVNELVSNSLKHAFPDNRKGTIQVGLKRTGDKDYVLMVSDNGTGFPKSVDFRNTASLGLRLVNALTRQLHGTIELQTSEGTRFCITFPGTPKDKGEQDG